MHFPDAVIYGAEQMAYDDHKRLATGRSIEEQNIYMGCGALRKNAKILSVPKSMLVIRMWKGGVTSLIINIQYQVTTLPLTGHYKINSNGILMTHQW